MNKCRYRVLHIRPKACITDLLYSPWLLLLKDVVKHLIVLVLKLEYLLGIPIKSAELFLVHLIYIAVSPEVLLTKIKLRVHLFSFPEFRLSGFYSTIKSDPTSLFTDLTSLYKRTFDRDYKFKNGYAPTQKKRNQGRRQRRSQRARPRTLRPMGTTLRCSAIDRV